MKNNKKIFVIVCSIALIILLTGITYSYFNYTRTGRSNSIITGDIYLTLNEGEDEITLTNVFPETKEEARSRNDNVLTFTVNGKNESGRIVYYEIDLFHGDVLEGYTRFNDSDLMFDLIEIGENNTEKYIVNAKSYSDLTNKRIWIDTIESESAEIERTYKLRMWLKEDIIISDSEPNASYAATGENAFKNHYASIKVKVIGDFHEKTLPDAIFVMKKNVDTDTEINFANASSDTNGKGVYILPGTENDQYPIYYYRGEIDNNNVVFGGFCWQMVRTTETGGIKMIYNGLPDISGSGNNITYNCGTTRDIQDTIRTTTSLGQRTGYYYADDYEIVSTSGNSVTYKLKSKTNPITQVAIANTTDAATNIPTISTNYPYTCKQTTDTATCTTLYKVDSYASGTNADVYSSLDRPIIGRSAFNTNYQSVSDVGYMSNTRYPNKTTNASANSIYGKDIEWHTNHYLVIEDTENMASTNTTKDANHHYSCGTETSSVGDTECAKVRYYYYNNYFIELENGDLLEDALYKMTGTGSNETKAKNASYVLNQNSSTAKTAIENWFKTNLTNEVNASNPDYSAYLEDTVFCNDRSFKTTGSSNTYTQSGWNPNGGGLTTYLYFGTYNRFSNSWYSTSNVPSMTCPNETDRFSVSSSVAHLNYPVGLLTADEIILAGVGGVGGNNAGTLTYYLYTNDYYWSLAPSHFYPTFPYEFNATNSFLSEYYVYSVNGLRPVVSLKLGTEFESGGDGTGTNPYVVKYN